MEEVDYAALRQKMVSDQLFKRDIEEPKILKAFSSVPRHLFVPVEQRHFAYNDCPLSIGEGQTISQPYMVALMTKVLAVRPKMSVLEIGTGSGYQAAILSFLKAEVKSIERLFSLAEKAKKVLNSLGYHVDIKVGDGSLGWPEYAPYDRIIITAAAPKIPPALIEELKDKGKIVIPLESRFHQNLTVVHKISKNKIKEETICGCVFVPLIGKYGYEK